MNGELCEGEGTFEVGENVSLHEIDINMHVSEFQGKGPNRVGPNRYKRDGDDVLNDVVCTSVEGALLTFRFRKVRLDILTLSTLRFMLTLKK